MNPDIIIIGAGGHAKVCIEILRGMGERVAVCVGEATSGSHCLDVPVVPGNEHLERLRGEGYYRAFVAIGANAVRARLIRLVREHGFELVNAISPHAVVSPSVRLGAGIAIMAGAVVNAETVLDDGVIVNTGATVDHDGRIGRCAHIAPQCALAGNVTVGEEAFLGIGTRAIPGIVVGARATVGAGAVLIRAVEPDTKVVGVPAAPVQSTSR